MSNKKEKFTPGPWKAMALFPSNQKGWDYVIYQTPVNSRDIGKRITFTNPEHDETSTEEAKANAYLMAAAPSMYQVLDNLQKQFEKSDASGETDHGLEIAWIKETLYRARGEKPPKVKMKTADVFDPINPGK